ncbi:MAG: hypothetical protein LUG95_01485 [Clostridiales bacterium]|nr:hypothetical protein [Clostridiales bacterium]
MYGFFALLLIPTISFFSASENTQQALPSLVGDDGKINTDFSDECEEYFSENLPVRDSIITINNFIKSNIFKSETSNVITGSDDYLFYSDTANDYLKTDTISDREAYCICKTISLINEYCENNGVEFTFVIAPNKNTVLSNKMPYNFISTDNKSNTEMIQSRLQKLSVNYIELTDILNEDLYLKNDSHWNNIGGYRAFEKIIEASSKVTAPNISKA